MTRLNPNITTEGTMTHAKRLSTALEVHGELAKLIAPATPESLRASNWRNKALLTILGFTALSFIAFIAAPFLGDPAKSALGTREIVQLVGAAGLGSGFYALSTATEYLRGRTFDPGYNQVYIIRFALGILAGFILGNFNLLGAGELPYGRTGLALVGGFASEAVVQVLKRVSETLLTLVRGNEKERAKGEMETDAAKQGAQIAMELSDAISETSPDTLANRIRDISKRLVSVRP